MIVVSDLVGTLSTGSPTLGLVSWVRHNQSVLLANMFLAKALPRYFLYKVGLMDMRDFGEWSLVASLPLIKEPTPEKIRDMAVWSVDKVLWPQRREDVLERIKQHREQGDELYIASTVFEPTIEALGERLGARAIGSQIGVVAGRLQLVPDLITGKRKGEHVFERLGVERLGAAYGDTWVDIPILKQADHPVAVYPDARLRAAAVENGWEIMDGQSN
ncbi:MAG: HAD family hydrolase [Anaerolineales bacterium]